jgi:hypothetical protein
MPHRPLKLGPAHLPVRSAAELPASNQQILRQRPDLLVAVLTLMFERFPTLTPEQRRKMASCQSNGSKLGWLLIPAPQRVDTARELDAGPLFPG